MRLSILLLVIISLSCDKQAPNGENTRLHRIVASNGSITGELLMTYDVEGNIAGSVYNELSPSANHQVTEYWTRNVHKEILHAKKTISTTVMEEAFVTYHPLTTRINYLIRMYNGQKDSSVVSYNGNVVTVENFRLDVSSGQYMPLGRTMYTFQNGNLSNLKRYTTSLTTAHTDINYTYDANFPPVQYLANDIIILNGDAIGLQNNITLRSVSFPLNGWQPYNITHSYTYLASGKPATSTISDPYGTTNLEYFYE